jgi:hypothetical protein
MDERLEEEKKRIKLERKTLIKDALLILIGAAILTAFLLAWKGQITGMQTIQTFDSEYPTITESTPNTDLRFEHIPNIKTKVGEQTSFKVIPNQAGNIVFSDNTILFDIGENGEVDFVPETPGEHRIFIVITNEKREYYLQDFRLSIEER